MIHKDKQTDRSRGHTANQYTVLFKVFMSFLVNHQLVHFRLLLLKSYLIINFYYLKKNFFYKKRRKFERGSIKYTLSILKVYVPQPFSPGPSCTLDFVGVIKIF